jgi:hypothetical protein
MESRTKLPEVCEAARAWHSGAGLAEIGARCSFLRIDGLALAHERGPAAAVACKWTLLRESWLADEHYADLVELIDAAFEVPELQQCFRTRATPTCASVPAPATPTAAMSRTSGAAATASSCAIRTGNASA